MIAAFGDRPWTVPCIFLNFLGDGFALQITEDNDGVCSSFCHSSQGLLVVCHRADSGREGEAFLSSPSILHQVLFLPYFGRNPVVRDRFYGAFILTWDLLYWIRFHRSHVYKKN